MRFIILLLSMATLVLYGRAVAGLGGFLSGKGSVPMIVLGLVGGTATAAAALILWKGYIEKIYSEREEKRG